MQTQTRDQREGGRASAPAAAPSPASLPDVNAETHPFEIVQHLLDQTADFNLFAVPVPHYAEAASLTPRDPGDWFGLNGGYGIALRSRLHRFDSFLLPPLLDRGVRTAQAVGESVGTLDARFFFCPDGFGWAA